MSEQTMTDIPSSPTPPPRPSRPPLRRSDDRVLGGVAGGVARWLDIDPTIVRVVLAVLAVFGGSGILLYALGWLLIPAQDASVSAAQDLLDRAGRPGSANRVLLIVLGVCVAVFAAASVGTVWFVGGPGGFLSGGTMLLLVTGGLVAWLLIRDQRTAAPRPASAPTTPPAPVPTASQSAPEVPDVPVGPDVPTTAVAVPADTLVAPVGFAYGGTGGGYAGYAPTPQPVAPRPRRPRSYLGLTVLSVALLVMGAMTGLDLTDVVSFEPVVVLATGLGILGIGMIVGAFAGRATWLLTIAIPLAILTALVAVVPAQRIGIGGTSAGSVRWQPTTVADASATHRLGFGEATLDLRDLPPGTNVLEPVTARVGVGRLVVLLPDDMTASVDASVGGGQIRIDGQPRVEGMDRSLTATIPALDGPASSTAYLDLEVGFGTVEVSHG